MLAGSWSPVASLSLRRSSMPIRESKPSSRKSRSGSTSAVSVCPRSSAAQSTTRSRRAASCSAALREAKCSRKEAGSVGRAECGVVAEAVLRGARTRPRREARSAAPGPRRRAAEEGRRASDSTERTGRPEVSTAAMDTESSPALPMRARSRVAPEACRVAPDQENGSSPWSASFRSTYSTACRAAVSSAGWRPNRAASSVRSGSSSSAKTSSPRVQTPRRPWKRGPYSVRS